MFKCSECSGMVENKSAIGLQWELLPKILLPIPEDIVVPRCVNCGVPYYRNSDEELISKRLENEYEAESRIKRVQDLIELLCIKHKINFYHLESACGVTNSYFTKIKSGKKVPSIMLERLLEVYLGCPQELERYLNK